MPFNIDSVPKQNKCRWFVRRAGQTRFDRGFRGKKEASDWIESLGRQVDWRTGYTFALRGDSTVIEIVDKSGNVAKP